MLKYLILSTPRCGSSTLMDCAEILFGRGSFVREPLNPYENIKFHPAIFHGATIEKRANILCNPDCNVLGIKHVYSPFNDAMADRADMAALIRVLSIPNLKIILLSRRNIRHQFISMEIALQSGDWWSSGANALPTALDPIKAGGSAPITDANIVERLRKLDNASILLREMCARSGNEFIEQSYEELFTPKPDIAVRVVVSTLAHLDAGAAETTDFTALQYLIEKGRRFEQISTLQQEMARDYPSLRHP